jgi:acetyltransferase
MDLSRARNKVEALTAPRNVVLVGASDREGSWAARVWRNLNRYEFPGRIYLINPRRTEIWDKPCYPDFTSLPEAPDHLVVLVPATSVAESLRNGAAAGARSATVFSAGFGESFDAEAAKLGRELAAVIEETGLGVSGPNCMGNVCAKTKLVTLVEDRPLKLDEGPVALVGQSGGMMIFTNSALEERGITAEYLITSGNEVGLSAGDYIGFFADQPEIKVIVVYIEAIARLEKFRAGCALARAAGKHVVALKLGQSEAGREAAMAHTASLAGAIEAFDALAADLGIIRADTLDDLVEVTELLARTGAAGGSRLGAITLSGAFRGLLLDAAEKNGLQFPALSPATTQKLGAVLTVGSLVSNPIDGGFGVLTSADNYMASIEALHSDPNIDMVLLQEGVPREPGSARAERYIALANSFAATKATKPVAFVTPISHGQTDYSRSLRSAASHVSFLQEANKGLRAIASVVRRDRLERLARSVADDRPPTDAERSAVERLRARTSAKPATLNEVDAKSILSVFGIRTPQEELVKSPEEAIAAAHRIGYPVVLKAVSDTLTHKSDAGAVALDLTVDTALHRAYEKMTERVRGHSVSGMLVCRQVRGGQELVLGLHRDPEIGLVVMAGLGGILIELMRDVAFAVPPISREKAYTMFERTAAARLLKGFRGGKTLDREAIADALIGLGRLATQAADILESIDINPLVALPQGEGALALDALIVLRGSNSI